MSTIWMTYSWSDNTDDVEYIVQELERAGLMVLRDVRNVPAGERLWDHIPAFIHDSENSDAWMIYATQNSLASEPCREEFFIALDRALGARSDRYPVIALVAEDVDRELLPVSLRIRRYVRLTDPDWVERIVASVEGREPSLREQAIQPYEVRVHPLDNAERDWRYAIEMRPRADSWSPFFVAVPAGERDRIVEPSIRRGPAGTVPGPGVLMGFGNGLSKDGIWWFWTNREDATPRQSYYLFCRELPSRILFGANGRVPQFEIPFSDP